ALPLLQGDLRPVPPADRRIPAWIADLDHNDYAVREGASAALEKLGEQARPTLRQALAKEPSAEARRRMEELLDKLEVQRPSPERVRLMRQLAVVEHMDTREARQLLEALAKGVSGAWLTEEAKAALRRLARQPGGEP